MGLLGLSLAGLVGILLATLPLLLSTRQALAVRDFNRPR